MSLHITHYLLVTIALTDQGGKWCFLHAGAINECFALLIVCPATSVIKQLRRREGDTAGHTVPDSGRTIQSTVITARVNMFMSNDVCNVSQKWDECKLCQESVCRMCDVRPPALGCITTNSFTEFRGSMSITHNIIMWIWLCPSYCVGRLM